MTKILMICHGNICRSTMAEFVLKNMVKEKLIADNFEIASVGTSTEAIGSDTHYGTKQKLREENIPFTKRSARQVTKKDYDYYDFLICMDDNNIRNLNRIIKSDPLGKVCKLLDFTGKNGNIADPWYTGNFDETYSDVVSGCKGLLEKLVEKK